MNEFKSIKVKEVMTSDVITVAANETMDKVAELFDTHSIHHIPVIEDSKVTGILSKLDYMKVMHGLSLFKSRTGDQQNKALLRSLLAKEVMTRPVVSLRPDQNLSLAADIFKENLFHAMPVVDENNKLMGILTTFDLLTYAYDTRPRQSLGKG